MANFDAALIKEQGVEFAVVAVRPGVISQPTRREDARSAFSASFGGVPVVLMEQSGGRPRFHGRTDLVDFLAKRLRRAAPLVELVAQLAPGVTIAVTDGPPALLTSSADRTLSI